MSAMGDGGGYRSLGYSDKLTSSSSLTVNDDHVDRVKYLRNKLSSPGKSSRCFHIIRGVVNTEKSLKHSAYDKITLYVDVLSSKDAIKGVAELFYNRKVKSVHTMRKVPKRKRFRGRFGARFSNYKKAVVTFVGGDLGVRIDY